MSAHLLIVEDDPALTTILEAAINYGGFTSKAAASGGEALSLFANDRFDAVLMDLGLPDRDGGELLQQLRTQSDVPILIVSGRGTEQDKIEALDLGADDFLAKPFLPGELLARIRAALRRATPADHGDDGRLVHGADDERQPVRVGALTLDPFDQTATLGDRGTVLSDAEYKVLKALATNADRLVSKPDILRVLYGDEEPRETKVVDVYISRIRQKLKGIGAEDDLILNRRGMGWTFRQP